MSRVIRRLLVVTALVVALAAAMEARAVACGGFFCQNNPVDQIGERIVFTVNDDATITSLIEIQYTGTADDFSWILPIPEAVGADALEVPNGGAAVFAELHALTDVRVIGPDPACQGGDVPAFASDATGGVEIFGSGEVGPFGFDIIGSSDADALTTWLRDNDYRVDPFMEPLIDVYVEEEFAFVAMRLLDGQDAAAIEPIEITYPGSEPMIPLRLTAVAAQPNMPIWVWIFADDQAVPANYANMRIDNRELTFSRFGGSDYNRLTQLRADALGGRAFITEFAGAANSLALSEPYLRDRRDRYLTRLTTTISPDEMTVDPVFGFDPDLADVSNVRDASRLDGLYDCERDGIEWFTLTGSDAINAYNSDGTVTAATGSTDGNVWLSWLSVAALPVLLSGFIWSRRRARSNSVDLSD